MVSESVQPPTVWSVSSRESAAPAVVGSVRILYCSERRSSTGDYAGSVSEFLPQFHLHGARVNASVLTR